MVTLSPILNRLPLRLPTSAYSPSINRKSSYSIRLFRLTRPSHLCATVSTQNPNAATPLITPSNRSPTKSFMYSTCLYLLAARSLSIAALSRPLQCLHCSCLLYTSDAADEEDSVDLGG